MKSKPAGAALAKAYHETGAPLRILAALFGREATSLSKILNGREPSRPFAMQLKNLISAAWDQETATATLTVRVPVAYQSPAERRASMAKVGVAKARKVAVKDRKKM